MRVLVFMGFGSYWGEHEPNILESDDAKGTVGGGEEACIRAATGLRSLGHSVVLYWYGKKGVWRGVEFRSLQDELYPAIVGEQWDAIVSFNKLRPLEWAPKGTKRIYAVQLNDLFEMGDWNSVDCIVSPSESHAQQLPRWGWKTKPYAVVHNGLDLNLYQHRVEGDASDSLHHTTPWNQRELNVGYWSSPDRGLHHVLRAWPLVRKESPSAKLHVFYEIEKYLKFATITQGHYGDRARILDALLAEAKTDKSIVFHGAVPRRKLAKFQTQCRLMLYPYDPVYYCEGFAGAVNQGVASGALVMTTPLDALPSLYGDSIYWLKAHDGEPDYHEYIADQAVRGLMGTLDEQKKILSSAKANSSRYTWAAAAKEMELACAGKWKTTNRE